MKEEGVLSKVKALSGAMAPHKKEPAAVPQDGPPWLAQVAVLTGVLAALTGFLTVRSTSLTNEAIYESNQAILSQTQASDAWAEYQANSIKAHVVEMQLLPSNPLSAQDKATLAAMDKDFRDRQPQDKQSALDKSKERQAHLAEGFKKLQQKDLLGYAGMAAQIAIALASVASLTRKRLMFHVGVMAGVASVIVTAYALAAAYLST